MATGESEAYAALVSLISQGRFSGGEPLRASRLAELIGMSRTPVREALSRLSAEGIVEISRNSGARLIELNDRGINEIYQARSVLEPYAAALAATNATAEQLDELQVLHEQIAEIGGGDYDEAARVNIDFHRAIVAAAGSQLLSDLYRVANREPLLVRRAHLSDLDVDRQTHQHRDILDAIRHGNVRWAEAAMISHIETSREFYLPPA